MSVASPTFNELLWPALASSYKGFSKDRSRANSVTREIAAWSGEVADVEPEELGPSIDAALEHIAKPAFPAAISRRLIDLIRYAAEDGEPLPLPESLSGLSQFLASRKAAAGRPLLATDGQGYVIASWRVGQVSMLSIKFLDKRKVQFAWAIEAARGEPKREWGESEWETFVSSFPYADRFFEAGSS